MQVNFFVSVRFQNTTELVTHTTIKNGINIIFSKVIFVENIHQNIVNHRYEKYLILQ